MIAVANVIGSVEPILDSSLHSFQGIVYEYNGKKDVQVCRYIIQD
jgi:hypothetical protein